MKQIVWKNGHTHMEFQSALKEFNLQTTVITCGVPLNLPTVISRYVEPDKTLQEFRDLGVSREVLVQVATQVRDYGRRAILYCFFHTSGRKTRKTHRLIDGLVLSTEEQGGWGHLHTWLVNTHSSAVDAVLQARKYVCNLSEADEYEPYYGDEEYV